MMPVARTAIGRRRTGAVRVVFRREHQILNWPRPVGLGRMLGLVGLLAAGVELLTWSFLGMPATTSVHAILIALTALASLLLLVVPIGALTPTTAHAAVVGAIGMQTGTVAATGATASPYLSAYVRDPRSGGEFRCGRGLPRQVRPLRTRASRKRGDRRGRQIDAQGRPSLASDSGRTKVRAAPDSVRRADRMPVQRR
jgi:hypothetical protein